MISVQKLYEATSDGLDILALHYPDVRDAARDNKPFKARPGERTASARVKLVNRDGYRVWIFNDFGAGESAEDPISVHMRMTGKRFSEAIVHLAGMFGVSNELNKSVNKPDIRKLPEPSRPSGDCWWEWKEAFTEAELKVMGPKVTQADCDALHWHSCQFIASVKDGTATYRYSTETFPIFMRECRYTKDDGTEGVFYKVYEPLNPDKGFRFTYRPAGAKPRKYTNGLNELKAAFKAYNDKDEKAFASDPANEGRAFRPKKLKDAVICSGERDAICVHSMGAFPLWFNSEVYTPSQEEYNEIMSYVETLYNIPDIDTTGRLRGGILATTYIDIRTVWLPDWLSDLKDNRGKPRKDFRDWNELRDKRSDFRELLETATPARFWTREVNKKGDVKYTIGASSLQEFLRLMGFYMSVSDKGMRYEVIRLRGNVVENVTMRDIRCAVLDWAKENGAPIELRDEILTTPLLGPSGMDLLRPIRLDFTDSARDMQMFFFSGHAIKVTAEGLEKLDTSRGAAGYFVREGDVIRHRFDKLAPMFEVTTDNPADPRAYSIEVRSLASPFFRYLINSSRLYWRKELEVILDRMPDEEAERYRHEHHFDIAGPLLTDTEQRSQRRSLLNKCFVIGYMLHRYKSLKIPWAPFIVDNTITDEGVSNGGSGKSMMIASLSHLAKYITIDGRNPRVMENKHVFSRVSPDTRIVLFDDLARDFPVGALYSQITGPMTVDQKNINAFTLPYEESPKFAMTTNFALPNLDGSTRRRLILVSTSDYYHAASESNDYRESRSPSDDLGLKGDLFGSEYPEELWNADINFMLQCVRFYLSTVPYGVKIEPDTENIIFRSKRQAMAPNFEEWAMAYFSRQCGRLDRPVMKAEAFDNYRTETNMRNLTMNRFTTSLKAFAYVCPWVSELNPADVADKSGRIIKKAPDRFEPTKLVSTEFIYLRSIPEEPKTEASPAQPSLPFAPEPDPLASDSEPAAKPY